MRPSVAPLLLIYFANSVHRGEVAPVLGAPILSVPPHCSRSSVLATLRALHLDQLLIPAIERPSRSGREMVRRYGQLPASGDVYAECRRRAPAHSPRWRRPREFTA